MGSLVRAWFPFWQRLAKTCKVSTIKELQGVVWKVSGARSTVAKKTLESSFPVGKEDAFLHGFAPKVNIYLLNE